MRISSSVGLGILLQQPVGADDHAGGAEAALQAVHFAKAFLQRVQRAVRAGDALDGEDPGALGLHREHGAGFYRLAVEIDGAGAAMAGLAADMRAGEGGGVAQEMHQQGARLDQAFHGLRR